MNLNEAIEELREQIETAESMISFNMDFEPKHDNSVLENKIKTAKIAISAIEEIQQYRAIGTVERFKQLAEQFKPHVTDKTSCPERHCNKCDKYRKENEKYHEIGTVEECREARERQSGKKINNRTLLRDLNGSPYSIRGDCPNCGSVNLVSTNTDYCNACGQKLDWSE